MRRNGAKVELWDNLAATFGNKTGLLAKFKSLGNNLAGLMSKIKLPKL